MGCRENLSHDIKDCIIIKCVTDFLKLIKKLGEYPAFYGVYGNKIKDQTIPDLAISVDTSHTLLKAIRVPWDVIVKKDITALEVDPFASRLSSDEYLNLLIFELLLSKQPCSGFIAGARLHATVDAASSES
ncbi:unnamed protein product, partial [marine sediment metagenome]